MPVRVSNPVHLTVLDPIDTSFVTRLTSARKSAGEIFQAFQIGGFGGVAFTTDPVERARMHIHELILTRLGERVMRPDYGTDVWGHLFEPAPHFASAELARQITQAVQRFEPGVGIQDVRPIQIDADGTAIAVQVSFNLAGFSDTHVAVFDITGNRIEI